MRDHFISINGLRFHMLDQPEALAEVVGNFSRHSPGVEGAAPISPI